MKNLFKTTYLLGALLCFAFQQVFSQDIYTAVAEGNVEMTRQFLEKDPWLLNLKNQENPETNYILCFNPTAVTEEYTYIPVNGEAEVDGMKIYVNKSTDLGGGYLVEVDGLTQPMKYVISKGDRFQYNKGESTVDYF